MIDTHEAKLTVHSFDISLKPDPAAIPKDNFSPVEWLKKSMNDMKEADEAIRMSQNLRDEAYVNIQVLI